MNILFGLLKEFASIGWGGIMGVLGQIVSIAQSGFQMAVQYHQESIAFARDIGLSAKQAESYSKVLTNSAYELANQYGISANVIKEIQRNISEATSRQLFLNKTQQEGFVQMNKLVGSQTTNQFTSEITAMGGQLSTVEGAVSKAYSTALKQGLSVNKLTSKVAQNLSMANRLSFKNGIDGIVKMVALSEKLGINMQSVESAARNFMGLDKAIEHSAHLQMLGGSAAVFGGNPLEMAYESNYDPEAFAERMSKTLASYAQFDAQKGISNINGMNMDFVRGIANAMGISEEDAAKMAKKRAEVTYKEQHFTNQLSSLGLTEEEKNFIINNSQVKNGQLYYTDINQKEHNISREGVDRELLAQMRHFANMSDKDILVEQARTLTSIDEQLEGTITSFVAGIADGLNGAFPTLTKDIKDVGEKTKEIFKELGAKIGADVKDIVNWLHNGNHKKEIIQILRQVGKIVNWTYSFFSAIKNHWMQLIAAILASKISSIRKRLLSNDGGNTSSGNALKKGARASKVFLKNWRGATRFGSAALKGANVAGWTGLGLGLLNDAAVENGWIEKGGTVNKIGSVASNAVSYGALGASLLGSIGGPIGAAIGAAIGGIGGGIYGYFDAKSNQRNNESAARGKKVEGHAQGGIVGGTSYSGDKILTGLNSGEMVLNSTQQANLFKLINGLNGNISSMLENRNDVKAKPVGEKEYIYIPQKNGNTSPNETNITVKDINLNINGTIKLDGGRFSKNLDANELLNDISFISSLKELIKQSINQDMNGGRFMNDLATIRGGGSPLSIIGR